MRKLLLPSVALALAVVGGMPAWAHSLKYLEDKLLKREAYLEVVDRVAPGFTLEDPDGKPVSLSDFRGKVVVLWFIYAGCPDFCPLQSEAIARIQEEVNKSSMRELVQFVSVTTDPVKDTPEILKAYGPARGLDPVNWVFLTSGPDKPTTTRELAEQYGLKFSVVSDEYQVHGVVTHLIDKSGTLRARYHGLKFNQANVILHLNALANDDH